MEALLTDQRITSEIVSEIMEECDYILPPDKDFDEFVEWLNESIPECENDIQSFVIQMLGENAIYMG